MFKRIYRNITVDEQASAEREVLEDKFVRDGDYFSLLPHETIITVTKERVTLSPNLCGQFEGRSIAARPAISIPKDCKPVEVPLDPALAIGKRFGTLIEQEVE